MWKRMRAASSGVQGAARRMRCAPTRAEAVLWEVLRERKLCGVRFRRQHAIDRFVLDFYSTAHKLAIEVDGEIHDEQQEQDAVRTEHLEARGIRVLRFRNEEVLHALPMVLSSIRDAIEAGHTGER